MKDWGDLKFWKSGLLDQTAYKAYGDPLKRVCPPEDTYFRAFDLTPFNEVRCVILGQDPYHTPGMAHGLAFSVPPHVKRLPPSLRRIFREYQDDLGYPRPRCGDLSSWAKNGVLLLNTILTVEAGKPLSHKGLGWEKLTIEVLQKINEYKSDTVFLLWGQQARGYAPLLDKCHVIQSPHPSPLAGPGFLGHRPFTRTNTFLTGTGQQPINWRLE